MTKRRSLGIALLVLIALGITSCALFQPPQLGIGMEEAIDVVVQEVLPDAVPEGATYVCIRMDDSLPAGSVIEEDTPQEGSSPQGPLSPKALTLGQESYLFFLDLAPGTYYEHPVKYIVVSKSGGYQVMDARWWPRVNGATPEPFRATIPDPGYVVAGNAEMIPPTGVLMEFDFALIRKAREGFIVVQGLMAHENLYTDATDTYLNGIAFFNAYKSGFSQVEGLVSSQAADVLNEIDSMVADNLNPITIYIIAHGGVDEISLGGLWFTAQQFHDKMAEYPETLFNFLLGSCHSGSFINHLNTLDNVRVIQTACATDEGATPDWDNASGQTDHNSEDTGSEWTSSILRAAQLIVESPDRWSQIQDLASIYNLPATSVLLDAAGRGALGDHSSLDLTQNLDLSNRVGHTTPQRYRSWFIFPEPILPFRDNG
jgi:hypothetical protein